MQHNAPRIRGEWICKINVLAIIYYHHLACFARGGWAFDGPQAIAQRRPLPPRVDREKYTGSTALNPEPKT